MINLNNLIWFTYLCKLRTVFVSASEWLFCWSYWRYVDDVWGLWFHGENSLHNFVRVANSIHPRIKLELRYSPDSWNFWTSALHSLMVTWKQIYLRKTPISSSHPKTVKESIPYGLGLRVKRICSDQNDYQKRKRDLKGNVKKRGYSSNLMTNNFNG